MPAPHCYKCNRDHEQIQWTVDKKVYRCNGCNNYGGHIPLSELEGVESAELEQYYEFYQAPVRVFTPSTFRLGVAV
jgi:hypothetical protein